MFVIVLLKGEEALVLSAGISARVRWRALAACRLRIRWLRGAVPYAGSA